MFIRTVGFVWRQLEFAFFGAVTPVAALFDFLGGNMRKVDNLGRIVIPKELRNKYGLTEGADITFEDSGNGVLVKGCDGMCRICGIKIEDDEVKIPLCNNCIEKIVTEYKIRK